ncbi:redoxin domain-containing protein [Dyadobacter jiangsuensis]
MHEFDNVISSRRTLDSTYRYPVLMHKLALYVVFMLTIAILDVTAQTPKRLGPGPAEEIEKTFRIVQANLDSVKAHRAYIFAKGMNNPLLFDQYEEWMRKYPENVNIPLAIGTVYYNARMPQPKNFLLRAATLDPKNAKIWFMLAADADMASQNERAVEYMEKAVSTDPSNASYAYFYLKLLENKDPHLFKNKILEFVKQFPTDQRGALGLYNLSQSSENAAERIYYLEQLRKQYPPQKYAGSASGMIALADAYIQTDLQKASQLISEMGSKGDWELRRKVTESLIRVNAFEQQKNYESAIVEINKIVAPRFNYLGEFLLLKKASLLENLGDTQAAYDSIAVRYAKSPTDALYNALKFYGNKVGKNEDLVVKDIDAIRYSAAIEAYPFDLEQYAVTERLNLKALKGKVVLLTFWFPGCGPCREEFPHFQSVVDSFRKDSLAYIGINIIPSQDGYVIPFMRNTKYSFIPLRGSTEFAEKNFGVSGAPQNFLIDKNGKIVFKDFTINQLNRRTLELMIASLLK